MNKFRSIFKNVRVIILLAALLLSIFAIRPSFDTTDRLAIRSIRPNSAADFAGMQSPEPGSLPMSRDVLISINDIQINTLSDYYNVVNTLGPNQTVLVRTQEARFPYRLTTQPIINQTIIGYEIQIVNATNETTNETYQVEEEIPIIDGTILGTEDLGIVLYNAPKSNIRLGLDLEGGVRVMLEPEEPVTQEDMDLILSSLEQRLNVYGLSDIMIRSASDLEGNQFIIVEIPGANEDEVRSLIGEQGRFEAKIGDGIAFTGGDDVRYVCRTAECSGIDPNIGCNIGEDGGWFCSFRFSITLSNEAAQRQAALTRELDIVYENNREYLSSNLDLYLDDELVDTLRIGAELRGQASTDIAISGSGSGSTRDAAVQDTLENMKKLQTLLITGSLPVSLDIVKTDAVSPLLGADFIDNAILVGLLAMLTVAIAVLIRYRSFKIALPMAVTMFLEVIIILGIASLLRWNLDLAAIAGIIIVAGTGVDHLIVITDSVVKGEKFDMSWKEKIKSAFSVIMIAYLTTTAAMMFLFAAGAGILRGFALTTILGVSIGVFIARPAYAAIIKILLKD